jgi:hypothetical protein
VTEAAGEPLITGAVFGCAFTVIENAASEVVALPSLTLMAMLGYEPTFAAVGVPESLPVLALNVAQVGLFATLKVSGSPSASLADGVKLYGCPAVTTLAGEPLIDGALFAEALTEIENAGKPVLLRPSLTRMLMFG